ncbi:MAG: FemAB family XrtA/PEP-CTERM system-associated protein [Terriglobales bacterium]
MQLNVQLCSDAALWDAFVHQSPQARIYHLWAWRQIIEATYGHDMLYLAASREETIQGILPLVGMKSRLFGRFLVSVPFVNYGGVLCSDPQVRVRLLDEAVRLAREHRSQHIELRHGEPLDTQWQQVSAKVSMRVNLPGKEEELWNRLSSRLRNKIRHAQKHGLVCRWGGAEQLGDFYSVFATNMRNLGTPVYPRQWFENVFGFLASSCRVLTVCQDRKPVAATILTTFREGVELPWIASTPEARSHYSTPLLYWTALEWAIQNRYRMVDLGRCTPGSGTHRFKQQWLAQEVPLHWYYWLAPGVPVPQLRPDNPRFRLAIRLWQRLPLFVANRLGPRIVRSIP